MARASERALKASIASLQQELDEARERLSSAETTTEDRKTNDETIAWERAVENSRRATLVAENWAAKAQAAISEAKAHEAELAAQAGALARARETRDAAEQATITAQLSLKEAAERSRPSQNATSSWRRFATTWGKSDTHERFTIVPLRRRPRRW